MSSEDKRSGPTQSKSILSETEQKVICEFRRVQRKLKFLKYQTPFDIVVKEFDRDPSNFYTNPSHMLMGLNM
jgi:hypothetical protein